jgi:asparagine synthase (glutamine-hydrolysing)
MRHVVEPVPSVRSTLEEPGRSFTERMMLADALTYLPDDILVKVDRAAIGVSLETRVPMLDPEVAAFAWALPMRNKARRAHGKIVLRKVLHRYVPAQLVERPKMGFGVPIDTWLRGPLREWGEALLSPRRLKERGLFDARMVEQIWQEHLEGSRNWHAQLWPILMFESWMESQTPTPAPSRSLTFCDATS